MKIGILVLLFVVGFTQSVFAKANFKNVPRVCQNLLLLQADPSNGAGFLEESVDWTNFYKHMNDLGYPKEIADEKILAKATHQVSLFEQLTNAIRKETGDSNWQFGDKVPSEALKKIVQKNSDNFLSFIPEIQYLAYIKNLNVPFMINEFLKIKSKKTKALTSEEVKTLAITGFYWLQGPKTLENAKLFYFVTSDLENVDWVFATLPKELRKAYGASIKKYAPELFDFFSSDPYGESEKREIRLLSSLPWKDLPKETRQGFEGNYLDFKKYPPLKTDAIRSVTYGYQDAGNCENMSNGHIDCLNLVKLKKEKINKANWKNAVFVRVNGEIVGEMKLAGDPSMIALRNVMDSTGRVIMAIGGVYHLGKDFYEEAIKAKRNSKGFKVVDFDTLQVHPHTFLLNDNAWDGVNDMKLLALALSQIPDGEMRKVLRELSNDRDYKSDSGYSESHWYIRFGLVHELDETRKFVEASLKR